MSAISFILLVVGFVTIAKCYSDPSSSSDEIDLIATQNTSLKAPLPLEWDWRENGGVLPLVKDQGVCGAGWAFSVIGAIESHRQIQLKVKEPLSEQFLLDCIVGINGTHGCSNKYTSDLQKQTYAQIITKFSGVPSAANYRKYSGKPATCQLYPSEPPIPLLASVSGFRGLNSDDFENHMLAHLVNYGPLVAAINSASMKKYKSGIDEPSEAVCSASYSSLNHYVLIVGYGTKTDSASINRPYWIIKNSWGEQWGEKGYYYLIRGRNACGIANDITLPFVDNISKHIK